MSDHSFSNQKSALEEYFESLLGDEETESAPVPATSSKAIYVPKEPVTSPVEQIVGDAFVSDSQNNDEDVAEPAQAAEAEKPQPSIADMLANVEQVAAAEPKVDAITEPKEFAEPEPVAEIVMPMPAIAEPEPEVVVAEVVQEVAEEVVVQIEEVAEVEEVAVVAQAAEPVQQVTGPPEWAESKFQCLLFEVGGLSLAVPLVKLNGVIPWTENVVETPNQTDWYLGVLMNHGNKVEVIDTAVMVLPAEHRQEMPVEPAERLSHILLVDDQHWGLACDSIGEVVWLSKDDVKWRSNKTKRPWLLGTAIEHMCAVMDTEAFADMLKGSK